MQSRDNTVEKELVINPVQSSLSLLFAQYGYEFLKVSLSTENLEEINGKSFEKLSDNPEVDIYESQYPFELTKDIKILKSVLKKSKLWLERATELNEDLGDKKIKEEINKLKKNLHDIEEEFQKIVTLEDDLKNLKI